MLTLKAVREEELPAIYARMQENFAREEIRDRDAFFAQFHAQGYRLMHLADGDANVGFIGIWELEGGAYVEHIAVYPAFRGKRYGSDAVRAVQAAFGALVLEIEPPRTPDQIRRLHFYERLGFVVNPVDYLQPPYREGDAPLPLLLLSCPAPLGARTQAVVRQIYERVYGLKGGVLACG